jgi:hypothetical protein
MRKAPHACGNGDARPLWSDTVAARERCGYGIGIKLGYFRWKEQVTSGSLHCDTASTK